MIRKLIFGITIGLCSGVLSVLINQAFLYGMFFVSGFVFAISSLFCFKLYLPKWHVGSVIAWISSCTAAYIISVFLTLSLGTIGFMVAAFLGALIVSVAFSKFVYPISASVFVGAIIVGAITGFLRMPSSGPDLLGTSSIQATVPVVTILWQVGVLGVLTIGLPDKV